MSRRVLVTGAAGSIGSVVREGLRGHYASVRLLDVEEVPRPGQSEEAVAVDLRDYPRVEAAMAGVDAVVHLAAIPGEAPFADISEHNMTGTYHVFEAARRQGARRVVFASSNHATGFYPVDERVGPASPVRPDSYYGVSKVFGEALARLYVDKFAMEAACLRIGSFAPRPRSRRELSTWISHRDTVALVRSCLDVDDLGFAIVYGVSANTRGWWENPDAERIGYRPVDDAEAFADELSDEGANDDVPAGPQGGPFAARRMTDAHPPGVPPVTG